MELRYIAIYRLLGLSRLMGDAETQDFVELPSVNATVKLTTNSEPFCLHLDRSSALAFAILNAFFRGQYPQGSTPEERLATAIEERRVKRQQQNKTGVFLVFEGTDDIAEPDLKIRHDMENFAVCFDAFAKGEVREKFRPSLYGALAAISMVLPMNADSRTEKTGDVS